MRVENQKLKIIKQNKKCFFVVVILSFHNSLQKHINNYLYVQAGKKKLCENL